MVSAQSPSKQKSESTFTSYLPWQQMRGVAQRAEKRFVEPLLTGDYGSPVFQQNMNVARGEATNEVAQMMSKLASMEGISQPAKQAIMGKSLSEVAKLAAGAGVKTLAGLAEWYDKIKGSMGQMSKSEASGGWGGSIGAGVDWEKLLKG